MSRVLFIAPLLLAAISVGCSQNAPLAPVAEPTNVTPTPQVDRSELDRLERIAELPDGGLGYFSHGRRIVTVPAGSHDALAAAIASVEPRGVVLLKSGPHEESTTVTITKSVTIIGETGAELVTSAGGLATEEPVVAVPVIHIRADRVTIQNLSFRPASGDGNTAILVDRADDALLFHNHMTGYQFGVVVGDGDRTRAWSNTIVTNGAWQTGAVGNAFAIVLVNGSYASVLNNDVSNSLFGIWPCGLRGQLAYNRAHGNFVGIIFCKVPGNSFQLPDGSLTGSEFSSAYWVALENTTEDNFTTGFLSIDGANHNAIASNASSGNGTYDIELAGDSYRFGFLTPTSFENTFWAGRYPTVEVKDCGLNNTIIGGSLVDNNVEPCN